jgi:signal transduction histidine kinase
LRTLSAPALAPDKNVFWAIAGTITVVEDISAFKELDQMKSDFMDIVAHEFHSPLLDLRQMNTELSEGLAGPLGEQQKDVIDHTIRKIDTLLDLVNDLLEVASVESGNYHRDFIPTDMSKILEEVVTLQRPTAEKQGLTLTYSCQDLPLIQANPKHMEKLMINLVGNAINYSLEGGKIMIDAKKHGGEIEITVRDSGIGISMEDLPKIFNRFYRGRHPKSQHVKGTGLGLSIVKGIIEAHKGSIEVNSFLNQGTIFRILLPAMS